MDWHSTAIRTTRRRERIGVKQDTADREKTHAEPDPNAGLLSFRETPSCQRKQEEENHDDQGAKHCRHSLFGYIHNLGRCCGCVVFKMQRPYHPFRQARSEPGSLRIGGNS